MAPNIVTSPTTLSPLPPILKRGLTAVSFFGFLSFACSVALFLHLGYKLFRWRRKSRSRVNQFIILIFNLVFADIQQSIAFWLNVVWLRNDAITVGTTTCFAQGWFVSTGDLASGAFTFAIALHSFLDIVFDYRLSHHAFLLAIASVWGFVYACAVIGASAYSNFYSRAGAWCWISIEYDSKRLLLHYLWIIVAEFGTVVIYTLIFLILRRRVKESFYTTSDTQLRAESAARLIIAYPIVYVLCTLPLVVARLTSMGGGKVTFLELCIAGSMITSNGWLDVVLYSVTRRGLLFGEGVPSEGQTVLETFVIRPDQFYGTTTTIEAVDVIGRQPSKRVRLEHGLHSRHGSEEQLFELRGVKAETVVQVRSEAMDLALPGHLSEQESKERISFDSRSK